jgi:hypothetical protein
MGLGARDVVFLIPEVRRDAWVRVHPRRGTCLMGALPELRDPDHVPVYFTL